MAIRRVWAASVTARAAAVAASGWQPAPKPGGRARALGVGEGAGEGGDADVARRLPEGGGEAAAGEAGEESGERAGRGRRRVDAAGGAGFGERRSKRAVASCSTSSQRPWSAASTGWLPEARPLVEAKKAEGGRLASQQVSTASKGTSAASPVARSRAGAQRIGSAEASGRASGRSRRGGAPRAATSAAVPKRSGSSGRSPCQRSIASMMPETFEAARVEALAVRDREGAGVGADDGEDLDAGAVEAGDPGDAGDAEVGEAGQEAGERRLGSSLRWWPAALASGVAFPGPRARRSAATSASIGPPPEALSRAPPRTRVP